MRTQYDKIYSGIIGACVGDALGVPVEFQTRKQRKADPVTDMREYGTHSQPRGTWSDDSSLMFCTMESLCKGFNLNDLADRFVKWFFLGYWTAYGKVFDIGMATMTAIRRLDLGVFPLDAGSNDSAGNGSLMRILPLAYLPFDSDQEMIYRVRDYSMVTHRHPHAVAACQMYVRVARELLAGATPSEALETLKKDNVPYQDYHRIVDPGFVDIPEDEISGRGYAFESLEAALWCLLTSASYIETVLKAVNLGDDTDTTAMIAGGLAGIYYGADAIPIDWQLALARKMDIDHLIAWFDQAICEKY